MFKNLLYKYNSKTILNFYINTKGIIMSRTNSNSSFQDCVMAFKVAEKLAKIKENTTKRVPVEERTEFFDKYNKQLNQIWLELKEKGKAI